MRQGFLGSDWHAPAATKTKPCFEWRRNGKCSKSNSCPYKHDAKDKKDKGKGDSKGKGKGKDKKGKGKTN